MVKVFTIRSFIPFLDGKTAIMNFILLLVYTFIIGGILNLTLGIQPYILFGLEGQLQSTLFKPWKIITYSLGTTGIWNLLGNGLFVYYFGNMLGDIYGDKFIYKLLIGCILTGAIFLTTAGLFFGLELPIFTVGIIGTVLVFCATIMAPTSPIYLFGIFKIEIRWIALVKLIFDFLAIIQSTSFLFVWLGNLTWGLLFYLNFKGAIRIPILDNIGNGFNFNFKKTKSEPLRKNIHVKILNEEEPGKAPSLQTEVDRILDKINLEGYESLTKKEKDTLMEHSKKI